MTKLASLLFALFALCGTASAQSPTSLCASGIAGTGAPSCAATLNPVGMPSAVESSHVLKAAAGTLIGFQANNTNAAARTVMVFDAASVPADGTVVGCANAQTARPCLMKWYQVPANQTMGVTWAPGPYPIFQSGIVFVCSSSVAFTKTASADCTFSGEVQ